MNENKPGNPWTKSLLIWMAVLFGLVLVVNMFDGGRAATGKATPYSQFVKEADEGDIKGVTIATSSTTGNATIVGTRNDGKTFTTTAPAGSNIADRLIAKGVAVQVKGKAEAVLQSWGERALPPEPGQKELPGADPTGHGDRMPPTVLYRRLLTMSGRDPEALDADQLDDQPHPGSSTSITAMLAELAALATRQNALVTQLAVVGALPTTDPSGCDGGSSCATCALAVPTSR